MFFVTGCSLNGAGVLGEGSQAYDEECASRTDHEEPLEGNEPIDSAAQNFDFFNCGVLDNEDNQQADENHHGDEQEAPPAAGHEFADRNAAFDGEQGANDNDPGQEDLDDVDGFFGSCALYDMEHNEDVVPDQREGNVGVVDECPLLRFAVFSSNPDHTIQVGKEPPRKQF